MESGKLRTGERALPLDGAPLPPHSAMLPRPMPTPRRPLDHLRVIEVGALETLFAGKLFADLGADVLVAEATDGHPARRLAPLKQSQ